MNCEYLTDSEMETNILKCTRIMKVVSCGSRFKLRESDCQAYAYKNQTKHGIPLHGCI